MPFQGSSGQRGSAAVTCASVRVKNHQYAQTPTGVLNDRRCYVCIAQHRVGQFARKLAVQEAALAPIPPSRTVWRANGATRLELAWKSWCGGML